MKEVLAAAEAAHGAVHVVHITSVGLSQTPRLLNEVKDARARGADATTESYRHHDLRS